MLFRWNLIPNQGCPVLSAAQQTAIDKAYKSLEFETGKGVIVSSSFPSLDMLAALMQEKTDMNLLIEGHTDNVGDDNSNMKLSEDRAKAVSTYLIKKGIGSTRIEVKYFGETKPIATNETEHACGIMTTMIKSSSFSCALTCNK